MLRYLTAVVICISACLPGRAQDSTLLSMLDDSLSAHASADRVIGTFKATHIINTPTVEAPGRRNLEFIIMHRFGKLNEGAYALFGLDNAAIRFGLDYGLTDNFSIGVGRSSLNKVYDGSVKWKLLRQTTGNIPVTVTLYGLVAHTTLRQEDKPFLTARYRTSYSTSLLVARKISSRLSLQVSPTWIHYNLVPTAADKNNVFAGTIGGRMKLTKRMSINAEYNYLLPDQVVSENMHNSLGAGIDLETGGHVFQLVFTNSAAMTVPYFIGKTSGRWDKGDIYFGFNISRAFSFRKQGSADRKKW
jgi:hypothetical protein